MAGQMDSETLRRTVQALYTVFTVEGVRINLAERHVDGIEKAVADYIKDHGGYDFVGAGHVATGAGHLIIDQPRPGFWTADSATAAWGTSVSTAYTDTNIFPTSALAMQILAANPTFREYLFGFIDVGSMQSVVEIQFASVNTTARTIVTPIYQSRVGGMRVMEFDPGLVLKEGGNKDINGQFEVAANQKQCQILPLAAEILPFQIAQTRDVTAYVNEV